MTKLSDFLSTLTTKDVQATLIDTDTESVLVVLKAEGYASLDDTIENRAVKKWSIQSSSAITIILGDAVENNASEPNNEPEPSNP